MIDNVLNAALCLCLLVGSSVVVGSAWQADGNASVATAAPQQLVAQAATVPAPQAAR
jgi:hypothetical protein